MFRRTKHSSKRNRLGRPTPAMAVACTALFMALGGVGYAAATVGSSQIKNNSVQGKDIKNSTIKTADISKGTRNSLKGQTGPAGSNGANVPSSTANVCGLLNGFDTTIDQARTATLNTTGLPGEIESVSLSGVSASPAFAQTISLRCTSQAGEVMDLSLIHI